MSRDPALAKTVIITGASRGIGAATAVLMAERGWDVAVGYRSDRDAAERVVGRCQAQGRRAIAVGGDVSSEEDVLALFDVVDGALGRLDAVVNGAGVVDQRAQVADMSVARLERMFAINVIGSFLCAREAIRRLSTRQGGAGGAIVNVSSAASRLGSPGEYVDYAASKGAIDSMTVGLAREVAHEGIRVNAVRPGLVNTDIHASGGQPDRITRLTPLIPMGRPGEPGEVAHAIHWLCSDEASYVTGALLDVSGGR